MTTISAAGPITFTAGALAAGDVTPPDYSGPTDFPAPAPPSLPTTWTPLVGGDPMLYTHRESLAAPTLDGEGRPQDGWQPTVTEEAWGQFRIVIAGIDVTTFRGVPSVIDFYELHCPFGCGPGRLTFPQLKPWDALKTGDLAGWTEIGADVDIIRLHPDGSTTTVLWSGQVASYDSAGGQDGTSLSFDLIGDLYASDLQHVHQQPYVPPTDLGNLIPDTLNAAVSRRHNRSTPMARVSGGTGIIVRRRAADGQGVVEYVQELLTQYGGLSDGSDAWTVGRVPGSPRVYQMYLKHSYSTAWTIRPGGRWTHKLVADGTTNPNAIYASGIAPTGYGWGNWYYPSGAGNILSAARYPMAYDERIRPRLWNSTTGADTGANPLYDPAVLRIEADMSLGSGVSRANGFTTTRAIRAQAPSVGWTGTITLEIDPAEGSRFGIREGDRITVQGFEGLTTLDLHISRVRVSPPKGANDGGTVELTVDQYKRDLVTVAGIIARDQEARNDPSRMPSRRDRSSKLKADRVVPFDGESLAGYIINLSIPANTWTRIDVPVSAAGKVAAIDFQTSPARAFVVAFFGDLGTVASDLVTQVGNPLTPLTTGYGPFDTHADALETLGLVHAIGGPGQACGYSRSGANGDGYETSPYTGTSTTLTGRLYDTGTWTYASTVPPYLRCFFWVTGGPTVLNGRILPAPLEL